MKLRSVFVLLSILLLIPSVFALSAERTIQGNTVQVVGSDVNGLAGIDESFSEGLSAVAGSVECDGLEGGIEGNGHVTCAGLNGRDVTLRYQVAGVGTISGTAQDGSGQVVVMGDNQVGGQADPLCLQGEVIENGVCVPDDNNPCTPNPCQQGGVCNYVVGAPQVFCRCPPGTEGGRCEQGSPIEIEVDDPVNDHEIIINGWLLFDINGDGVRNQEDLACYQDIFVNMPITGMPECVYNQKPLEEMTPRCTADLSNINDLSALIGFFQEGQGHRSLHNSGFDADENGVPDCMQEDVQVENDDDNDGVENGADNCPNVENFDQLDRDNDGVGDVCDSCPRKRNPEQIDTNINTPEGDACDANVVLPVIEFNSCPQTMSPGEQAQCTIRLTQDLIGEQIQFKVLSANLIQPEFESDEYEISFNGLNSPFTITLDSEGIFREGDLATLRFTSVPRENSIVTLGFTSTDQTHELITFGSKARVGVHSDVRERVGTILAGNSGNLIKITQLAKSMQNGQFNLEVVGEVLHRFFGGQATEQDVVEALE